MEQVYYTSCPVGYGLGTGSGYQVKRKSSGYPATGDWSPLAFRPFVGVSTVLAPGRCVTAKCNASAVAWITPRATEYETERGGWGPGGYFGHVVRLGDAEMKTLAFWAAGLFDRPSWCRSDPSPSQGRPPRPLRFNRDDLMVPPASMPSESCWKKVTPWSCWLACSPRRPRPPGRGGRSFSVTRRTRAGWPC